MAHWRDEYDAAADDEALHWRKASDRQLVEAIEAGDTGEYFAVWREIACRPRSSELCWLLFGVLQSERGYLDRYHCASALLQLIGCTEIQAVEVSANWPSVPARLERLRALVTEAVGAPPQRR